jgi:hypothetical protein
VDQPPVDNETEFEADPQLIVDKDGEKLALMLKATFVLPYGAQALEVAPDEDQRILRMGDLPWGKPEISSIAYPSDVCLRKPGTDVVVVARAFPPHGQPAPTWDVFVQVGALTKALRVFGLRVWEVGGSGISPPRPVESMEMRYDFAWGGSEGEGDAFIEEPRNPVGMGFVRDPATLTDRPAPNIEDPQFLISSYKTRPPPAGIGPIGRHWEPRRRYAGTYDKAWTELRMPLPPEDFDDRFNICASPGLHSDVALVGGEPVSLLNLVPGGGGTRFSLPSVRPEIEFKVAGRETQTMTPHLDTVIIDALDIGPDEPLAVELVWRAHIKAPKRMKDVRIMVRA